MDWSYLFLRFDGRISRKPYWIASGLLLAASFLSWLLIYRFQNDRLSAIVDLALLYPDLAVIIKRAHDREMSYRMPILYLILSVILNFLVVIGMAGTSEDSSPLYMAVAIPDLVIALYLAIDLGFRKGTPGPNRHGPDPLERPT